MKLGDKRRLRFWVNDFNPAIIAKDILLLSLAAQTPSEKGVNAINSHTDLFLSVWADLALTDEHRQMLDIILTKLLNEFTGSDECFMTVTDSNGLWQIKRTWAIWLTTEASLESASTYRANVSRRMGHPWGIPGQEKSPQMSLELSFYATDLTTFPSTEDEMAHYLHYGTMVRPGTAATAIKAKRNINPTLRDPQSKQFPQLTSNPFITYLHVREAADFSPEEHTLYWTLHSTVRRLLLAFEKEVSSKRVSVFFDVGDCNEFLATRLDTEVKFDVIDTSNILDHTGLLGLLTIAVPRLKREEPCCTLWTETMKAQTSYCSADEFLKNPLPIPYSILPTTLKVQCHLPFEGCLDFRTELGVYKRKRYLTGIKLKWKSILPSGSRPCKISLVSQKSNCLFRKMIDNVLSLLSTMYQQKVIDFDTFSGFYPNPLLNTIPGMFLLLINMTQQLTCPKKLFQHLYGQVESNEKYRCFRFEVQNVALQLCPAEWQPHAVLHELFQQCTSAEEMCVYFDFLQQTSFMQSPIFHSCPIVAGILVHSFTQRDYDKINEIQLLYEQSNLRRWIQQNFHRVQFIDSFKIIPPCKEVEVSLPKGMVYPKSPYSLLLFALETGLLVFEPLRLSGFKMRLDDSKERKLLSLFREPPGKGSNRSKSLAIGRVHEMENYFDVVITLSSIVQSGVDVVVKAGRSPCEIIVTVDSPEMRNEPLAVTLPNFCKIQEKSCKKWIASGDERSAVVTIAKITQGVRRESIDLDNPKDGQLIGPSVQAQLCQI